MDLHTREAVQILIVPSSDEERFYEEAKDFDEAERILEQQRENLCPDEGDREIFWFDTEAELNAFIKGYESAIGNLGSGMFFTKVTEQEPAATQGEQDIITRLGTLVSEDAEKQLQILKAYIDPEYRKTSNLNYLVEDIGISTTEAAEHKYSVRTLCDAIGLNIIE